MTAYPLPANLLAIPGVQPLELEVAEVGDLGPRFRRVLLTGETLDSFAYKPGQDVMLVLGMTDGRPLSRRYTIRDHNPERKLIELNIVAHGVHGPGAHWAANARPGDRVNGVGPRGKIFVNPDADWHVFLADESGAPASLRMLESLPAGVPGEAYLEVTAPDDELPTTAGNGQRVHWIHRGEVPPTASDRLAEAISSATLPPGRGHVYIAGEVQLVAEIQRAALARGLAPEQLSPKAYWGRGRPNAARGEPD